MKTSQILLIALVGLSASFTSCTTRNLDDDASVQGIQASDGVRKTREDLYRWQDRTFRELAY